MGPNGDHLNDLRNKQQQPCVYVFKPNILKCPKLCAAMASLCEEHFSSGLLPKPSKFNRSHLSPSPSAHNYFLRTSVQKRYTEKKAKRVFFFKNGDRFHKGSPYAISPEKIRTYEALLEDLTRLLIGLPQGVRYIFSLDGRRKITSLDQFEEGQNYVCASTDHYCKMDYLKKNRSSSVRKLEDQPSPSVSSLNGSRSGSPRDYVRPKLLTIIRNGSKPRKVVRVLLNKKTAHSFDQVLGDISNAIKLDSGVVRKVFTLGGKQVTCLADFFGEEDILIAYGPEKYSHDDFELDLEECKYLSRSPLVGRKTQQPLPQHSSSESECPSVCLSGCYYLTVLVVAELVVWRSPKKTSTTGVIHHPPLSSSAAVAPPKGSPISPASIPPDISQRYQIGRQIGDGNFATVFECTDKNSQTNFALKVINKVKCQGKLISICCLYCGVTKKVMCQEHMIANEVSILRHVKHPNIVQLQEDFDIGGRIYLVMELVNGGDLLQAIATATKYSERDGSGMVSDLAQAMSYLHARHIVHRDIKPENLLSEQVAFQLSVSHQVIEYKDGSKSLKLGDFGLAIECKQPLYSVCGTPTYVAPEVLAETGYGTKVDVWAAGIISYILLCGFPPFHSPANDQEELYGQILAGKFTFLSPYWDNISHSAKDLISHMLELNPDRRFSADDVLDHPWIAETTGVPDRDLHGSVMTKLTAHFHPGGDPEPAFHPPSPVPLHSLQVDEELTF
ncbi:DCLK1 [Cordylochernes scorpioides]|uniref:non-specific serine/threonine protein kinase n=1 Tax=Cordylochernes scorpioides TaxID=51811 RepID=A0ABY6KZR7_9ARAC|nr:DCLK1 [Cordylochernes scorpioides]